VAVFYGFVYGDLRQLPWGVGIAAALFVPCAATAVSAIKNAVVGHHNFRYFRGGGFCFNFVYNRRKIRNAGTVVIGNVKNRVCVHQGEFFFRGEGIFNNQVHGKHPFAVSVAKKCLPVNPFRTTRNFLQNSASSCTYPNKKGAAV
jgi:hypothetical protein